jgi:hypothetical protein
LVKALVQIASTNADQELVRKILDKIHEVSEALKAGLVKLEGEESQAQQDYEDLVK